MPGGAFGRGIVENDQRVDGDAGPGIDQKRIDVDRGDAGAGIRHQVGQADKGFDGRRLVQRRLAAIALQLHAGLGLADQLPGLGSAASSGAPASATSLINSISTPPAKSDRQFRDYPPNRTCRGHSKIDANDPACVKTPTSNLRVESLSPLR